MTGFDEQDLQSAVKVLQAMSDPDQKELIRHNKFIFFRKALRAFLGSGEEK
jgi:hypothetical protein